MTEGGNSKNKGFMVWISNIRNAGVVLGVPAIIVVGVFLYNQRIDGLKEQIEHYKSLSYSEIYNQIDAQKKLYVAELDRKEKELVSLRLDSARNQERIRTLKNEITSLELTIASIVTVKKNIRYIFLERQKEFAKLEIEKQPYTDNADSAKYLSVLLQRFPVDNYSDLVGSYAVRSQRDSIISRPFPEQYKYFYTALGELPTPFILIPESFKDSLKENYSIRLYLYENYHRRYNHYHFFGIPIDTSYVHYNF